MNYLRNMVTGPWSDEEDMALKQAYVEDHNNRKQRSFHNVLLPSLNNNEDTLNDDSLSVLDDLELKLLDIQSLNDRIGTFLPTYAKGMPPNWRNISHYLNRKSTDCRLRFIFLVLGRDLDRVPDVWFEGEAEYLRRLVVDRNFSWSAAARELGRTSQQCASCYSTGMYRSYGLSFSQNRPQQEDQQNKSEDTTSDENNVIFNIRKHYKNGIRSRTWDSDEDALLLQHFATYGNKWKQIGNLIHRPGSQCFQRYQILKFQMENGRKKWTNEEYEKLFQLVNVYGPRWTYIGVLLGRTAYVCRSAYKRIIDKMDSSQAMPIPRTRESKKLSKHTLLTQQRRENASAVMNQLAYWRRDGIARNESDHHSNYIGKTYQQQILSRSVNFTQNQQRLWSKEEDDNLRVLVATYGRKWTLIAEEMNRSPEDVMLRFDFKITKQNKAGSWTREEDLQLLELIENIGPKWALVGAAIGRSGSQCSLRYRLTLNPTLKWRLWSPLEDNQLISLREESGYNW
eukprot:CAMPEP_0170061834 /NCGR_PEP_ID=MMETSP0019_2-20121128/3265_1 /TAXON_ID=98059 /ORGANISM="Dinobryon sp., Strain UTEXLB2267" /LENGTH=510 /DNA_ID=CAMNT_0010267787 /DNA_START=233 /DNA_END=1762 /DNA_ORIENTATION=+